MERVRFLLIAVLMLALTLTGCGAAGSDGSGDGAEEPPPAEESPGLGMVAPPGIYDLPGGDSQALGILTYRDLEGGFWAVANTAIPEEAATADILAVVLPAEGLEVDLQTMNGEYVSVVGTRSDGPSIYMAGPIIEAKTVEIVSDTAVE